MAGGQDLVGALLKIQKLLVGRVGEIGGAGRDDEDAGGDDVGLEPAESAFLPGADVAGAGEVGDLIAVGGRGQEDGVGGLAIDADLVGDMARAVNGADGDDVLGRAGGIDGVLHVVQAAAGAFAGVAGGEDVGHGLLAGDQRLGVAHRRVEAGGGQIVARAAGAPAVVGDETVGDAGGGGVLAQVGRGVGLQGFVGDDRPDHEVNRLHPELGQRGHAAKVRAFDGAEGVGDGLGIGPVADHDAGDMRAVAIVVGDEIEEAAFQLGMGVVGPGVVQVHPDVGAVEAEVIGGRDGVGGDAQAHAGQVAQRHAAAIGLDLLGQRPLGHRDGRVRPRNLHDELGAEGRAILAEQRPAPPLDLRARLLAGAGRRDHAQGVGHRRVID